MGHEFPGTSLRMATDTREVEWKYEVPPDAPVPDLTGLPRVAAQTAVAEEFLEAVYYDTTAFDLLRAGVTLRRRAGGADAGWHLKVPGDEPGVRAELRLPDDERLPDEFADLLTARVRGRALRPVAQIATRRRVSLLKGADDQALAEVALDEVTAESFGSEATLTRWNELEIELADGADEGKSLLEAADRQLHGEGIQRSSRPTKLHAALARSLDALDAVGEQDAASAESADNPAAAPVLAYLRGQLEKITTWDMAVRRDEFDSVHQMRVAARRMRAALQAFEPMLRGERVRNLIDELRWIGQELGDARDAEVLAEHLSSRIGGVRTELVLGPVSARVEGHYGPLRAAARREMLEALASERYVALLRALEGFLKYPTLAPPAPDGSDSVPALVYRAHRRTRRRMRRALKATPGPQRDTALHEVRKAAKRARYASEVAALDYGKKARRSARGYKKLQSLLGDHHDAVISAAALRELALHAYGEGENAFTYGLLYQRELDDAARLGGKAPRTWKRASRSKRIAWMKSHG